jgi:hypothetical protein
MAMDAAECRCGPESETVIRIPRVPPTTALLQSMFMRRLATAAKWPHAEESSSPDSRRGVFFLVIFRPVT